MEIQEIDSKEIFIVTSGTYSDYRINAVFSTRELAERAIKECADWIGYEIELFPIDEKVPVLGLGFKMFSVHLSREGNLLKCEEQHLSMDDLSAPPTSRHIYPARDKTPSYIGVTVLTKSEEQAIKIANDVRAQSIANNEW